MKYGELNLGQIEALVNKLGGMDSVRKILSETAKVFVEEIIQKVLHLIPGAKNLIIGPTDGTETIAKSADIFTGYLDSNFQNYGTDVPSKATGDTAVAVHELVKNATFQQMFTGDLDKLCLTQGQIIQFVKTQRKWLRTDGYATFFLFKVGNEFFVALVSVRSGGQLDAHVYRFSYATSGTLAVAVASFFRNCSPRTVCTFVPLTLYPSDPVRLGGFLYNEIAVYPKCYGYGFDTIAV